MRLDYPVTLREKTWSASDGKTMPYAQWKVKATSSSANAPLRSVVIGVHGLSGAASDFNHLGEFLSEKDSKLYGLELRGMGNDPEKSARGDIESSDRWQADLHEFTELIQEKHPSSPIYWYGESMGSLICLHAANSWTGDTPISGLVMSSPVVSYRMALPFWKTKFLRGMMRVFPRKKVSLERLGESENVQVTSSTTHKSQMNKTPHYVEHFTLRTFREIDFMVQGSDEAARALRVPLLVFYTPNDVFTSQEGVESFFELVPANKRRVLFKNSYHLILHDHERDDLLGILDEWLPLRNEPPSFFPPPDFELD